MRNTSERGLKELVKGALRGMPALPAWVHRLGYYGLALLFVAAAAMLRWELRDVLSPTPTLVFYLAWVGAAAFGGLGPGLLATVASWLCIDFLFDPTPGLVGFADPTSIARLWVLLAGGLVVSVVGEKMRRTRIREREQEEALRESEERYHRFFDDDVAGDYISTPEGRILLCNPAFAEMFGFSSAQEAVGTSILDLYPDPGEREALLERLKQERKIGRFGVWRKRRDGELIHIVENLVGHFNNQSQLYEIKGYLLEDTERKRAEEALRKSEEKYRTLFDSIDQGFCIIEMVFDADGRPTDYRFLEVNPAFEKQTGLHEAKGKSMRTLAPDHEAHWFEIYGKIALTGEPARFVNEAKALHRWYDVYAFRADGPEDRKVAILFNDITARRQAEEAAAESRKRYQGFVEKINDWVWEIDADGVYTYSSPRALGLLGYPPEEIVGKTPFDFMPPAEAERVSNAFRPIWLERKPLERLENMLMRKDGSLVTVETSGMPVFAEDGAFLGYTGVDRDVTARKRAEEALRASQSMLQSVMENVPQGIFWKDRHSTYLGCNKVFAQAAGLESAGDIIGKTDYDLPWSPEQTASFREYDRRIMENDAPEYHIIEQQREVDGKLAWLETNKVPLHDAQGNVIGILGTYEDITERKQAEDALRESEEKFRLLAETSPAAILIYQDDKYVYANPAVESISGYRRAELLPQAPGDIVHPDYRQQVKQMVSRRAQGEGPPVHYELKILTKDGQERWMDSTTVSITYGGKPAGLVVAFDITERKRAEEALRELNATLEDTVAQRTAEVKHRAGQLQKLALEMSEAEDRERRRLAEILHDDLQQVLAAAKFHLGLMKSRAKYDASLQATAAQIDHMLKDAIEKSRSLSHELSPAVSHHGDLVETLGWLAGQIRAKHGLLVHVRAHAPVHLQSDALKAFLYKAAQELLFNVIKHARVTEARIRVRRLGRCVCLSVSDRGRGFDPQELGETAGFGLLSIRERIELLGGRMKIKSAKGKGSTFFIVVPDGETAGTGSEVDARSSGRAEEAGHAADEDSGRLRVLLADDHKIVRQGLASLLDEMPGIEVVGEASNGREAVDLASRLRPDVVIMDVAMPMMSGDEATRRIKRLVPDTRVIALSMFEDAETAERMLTAGAEAYVLKTAPSEELSAAIRGN